MVKEGLCTKKEALLKVEPDHIKQVLCPTFSASDLNSAKYRDNIIAVGLAGGPGVAVGKIVFHTDEAEARTAERVILDRENTSLTGRCWRHVDLARYSHVSRRCHQACGCGRPRMGQALRLWLQ